MKKLYKAALLAALGLTGVTAAHAQSTDMTLGFTDAAGPSAAQNDYVIDLGVASQFTTSASLNLSSSVNWSTLATAYSADSSYLNNVTAAALQSSGAGAPYPATYFQTGSQPGSISFSVFNNLANNANSAVAFGVTASSSGVWSTVMLPGAYSDSGVSTLAQASSGIITETVWEVTKPSYAGTPSPWADIGTFNINLNTDSLTFNGVSAVPEPSTYALFGGAGLMLLVCRNKFRRVQI